MDFVNSTHLMLYPRVYGNFSFFIRAISIGDVLSFKPVSINVTYSNNSVPLEDPFIYDDWWLEEAVVPEETVIEEVL